MTSRYIPKSLRERVSLQAKYRCGYCLTSEFIIGAPMEIDHIIPVSLGGPTQEDNLWLACSLCNDYKGERIAAIDPVFDVLVRLFNPREQVWSEHFSWSTEGDRIVGLNPIGRATVLALKLNRPSLIHARRSWVSAGWHPPE